MKILLAGSRNYLLTSSDRVLASALERRGVEAVAQRWDEIVADGLDRGDLACIRSPWDYFLGRAEEFRRWLESFARNPERLVNPPETALWNLDKVYLRELHDSSVAIPETHWIESVDSQELARVWKTTGWDRAVVKPRVAGGGHGTYRIRPGVDLSNGDRVAAFSSGALVQEYVTEIESRGEVSLIYLAGTFSHAVVKRSATGDFRVQSQFGGTIEPFEAAPALQDFGADVLRHAGKPWVYARVDIVERAKGPVLMELEILEPDLFFLQKPEGAEILADELIALARR